MASMPSLRNTRRVDEELTWKVRDEADGRGSRQEAPPKAYFYWKEMDDSCGLLNSRSQSLKSRSSG